MASFDNHLLENVTNVLSMQDDLDRHLEQRIDTLYDIVQIMEHELLGMKVRSHLECHTQLSMYLYSSKNI